MTGAAHSAEGGSGEAPSGDTRRFGLCASCRHARRVGNTRGSEFSLCERSKSDPRYPKYPRMPVLECPGYDPGDGIR